MLKSAEQFKNIVIEAESIKFKLETKEEEIREIKKTLKAKVSYGWLVFAVRDNSLIDCVRFKTDELSEQKLRISLVEKKGEEAVKELDEKNKKLLKINEDLKLDHLSKEK